MGLGILFGGIGCFIVGLIMAGSGNSASAFMIGFGIFGIVLGWYFCYKAEKDDANKKQEKPVNLDNTRETTILNALARYQQEKIAKARPFTDDEIAKLMGLASQFFDTSLDDELEIDFVSPAALQKRVYNAIVDRKYVKDSEDDIPTSFFKILYTETVDYMKVAPKKEMNDLNNLEEKLNRVLFLIQYKGMRFE